MFKKNRNMKLFYKVLYHDGQWSLSTIGKDYLAVEMASIMVHLTSKFAGEFRMDDALQ